MNLYRNCNLETFYKGLRYQSLYISKEILRRLDPDNSKTTSLESQMFYIIKIKELNPSVETLWKIRDEIVRDVLNSILSDLKDIQNEINKLK